MTDITLLDGSIGQELVHRTTEKPTGLWSTKVMIDHPHLVRAVHEDYVAAGATMLSTNTYPVHISRLERVGLADRLLELVDIALTQAEAAKGPATRVAGCLGPLMASYRPDIETDLDVAEDRFGTLALAMKERADVLLLETVSSLHEAEGALRGAAKAALPIWIAFSVDDQDGTRLRSGEAVSDVLPLIEGRVEAVLINCSRPEAVSQALPSLRHGALPFGAYANGFTNISDGFKADFPTVDALDARTDLDPKAYAAFAMDWVAQGATIVGGCCEVGPAHIAELAQQLQAAGHRLV